MALGLTIEQLVASNLPAGFVVSDDYITTRLKFWQLFLAEAAELPEGSDVYDINVWTALEDGDKWLMLLAYCVTYDIYLLIIAGKFIALGSSNGEEGGGEVKKIVTGPTEVEFHDSANALAVLIKNMKGPNGIFDAFLALACGFASQLGVKLPFCAQRMVPGLVIGKKRPLRGERYFDYIIRKTTNY